MKLALVVLLAAMFIIWPFKSRDKRKTGSRKNGIISFLFWAIVVIWVIQLLWYMVSRLVK